jgi:hypothetical protein
VLSGCTIVALVAEVIYQDCSTQHHPAAFSKGNQATSTNLTLHSDETSGVM